MHRIAPRILLLTGSMLLLRCSVPSSTLLVPKPDHSKPPVQEKLGDVNLAFSPKVDILLVVDNSGSMEVHQKNLARNIRLFTHEIEANKILDYHIGVLTTAMRSWRGDNCCGQLVGTTKFVSRSTLDGRSILESNLMVGTSGSTQETVFDPPIAALTEPLVSGVNAGFYRKDAFLALIFITDAEDQGQFSVGAALATLRALKPRPNMIVAYGVIAPVRTDNCKRDETNVPAIRIEEFVNLAGGFTFSLCAPDFGDQLAHLADDLMGRVSRWLPLGQAPIVSTIRVKYGTQVIPMDLDHGWWFDAQRVSLVLARGLELDQNQVNPELTVSFVPADL